MSGRGLCDELITRPEESYRLWCVVVCDLETSWKRRPWPALGRSANTPPPKKKERERENAQRIISHNDLLSKTAWVKKAINKQFFCFNAALSNVLEKIVFFTVSSNTNLLKKRNCCTTHSILQCWEWHVSQQHTHKALLLSTGKNGCNESIQFSVLRTSPICIISVHYTKVNQTAEGFLSLDNNMKLA
jgi:hypothetical protein